MSELYHPVSIGNINLKGNLFLAPVAGYSDAAFRSVCIENGACFTYTEMVSAEALVRKNLKTEILMRRACNESAYAVQIFGGEAEVMAQAALIVLEKTNCECIDINCGCPVPKIVKTGAGSALTRDPDRLFKVVEAVVGGRLEDHGGVVVVQVHEDAQAAVLHVAGAADGAGLRARLRQRGQQHRRQNGDDRDDDQQLDQGEGMLFHWKGTSLVLGFVGQIIPHYPPHMSFRVSGFMSGRRSRMYYKPSLSVCPVPHEERQ